MNNITKTKLLFERRGKKVKGPGKWEKDGDYDYYITTPEAFLDWYNKLDLDDMVDGDVVLDTGEVVFQKGETRRKKLKKKGTREYSEWSDKSFETIKMKAKDRLEAPIINLNSPYFRSDFEDFYSVKFDSIYKIAGVDKDEFMDKDYDVEMSMPSVIKRKDGMKLKNNDVINIKNYVKWANKELAPINIKFSAIIRPGKNEAKVEPFFN